VRQTGYGSRAAIPEPEWQREKAGGTLDMDALIGSSRSSGAEIRNYGSRSRTTRRLFRACYRRLSCSEYRTAEKGEKDVLGRTALPGSSGRDDGGEVLGGWGRGVEAELIHVLQFVDGIVKP
jgi:hypothetical protein